MLYVNDSSVGDHSRSDSDFSESDISVDGDGDPLLNEMVNDIRYRGSRPKPFPAEIVTDTENCNYLNDIAICILLGIFVLLFLLFTSHRECSPCSNKRACLNILLSQQTHYNKYTLILSFFPQASPTLSASSPLPPPS